MHNPRPLCLAPHCAIRARHKPDCAHRACVRVCPTCCWGCLPRPAADGLNLCHVDIRRIAEDAAKTATLHAALERTLIRTGGPGEKTSGSATGAPVPDDEVIALRSHMRGTLLAAVRLISQERGITYPQESFLESLPDGFIGPPRLLRRVTEALPAAAVYIARHAEWLAGHRYAAAISRDLRGLAGDGHAWALAYPAGSGRLYVGDCPAPVTEADGSEGVCASRLYQYPSEPLITCVGCGIQETIEQWRRWLVGDAHGQVDAYAVSAHLAMMWMRPVDPGAVKKWAQRGHIQPVVAGEERRIVRDARNRTLYTLAECVDYASSLWGPPARMRRAS